MLVNFQMFGDGPGIFLLFISSLILLQLEKKLYGV